MMRYAPCSLALALTFALPITDAPAAVEIGKAMAIKKSVTGKLDTVERQLNEGDPIHQEEKIETSTESEGEFVFQDDTKLAVGPDSEIVLDKFVYDPTGKSGEIVINAAKGAFRFISGKSAKTAYKINTPVTTIGVRGTVFDGFVNSDGEIALLLVEGEIDVCPTPASCRRLNKRGFFYHIRRNGHISDPLKWDGSFLPGVDFNHAFPFIGRKLRIDPVQRFRRADLLGGRLLRQGIRPLRQGTRPLHKLPRQLKRVKPRLPRIRQPF